MSVSSAAAAAAVAAAAVNLEPYLNRIEHLTQTTTTPAATSFC